MTTDEFWRIIERSRRGARQDPERQLSQLRTILNGLAPERLVEFGAVLHGLHADSYRGHLWGAAYLINGGCSDDAFDYFRAWLIAQGKSVFEAAIADPDTLAKTAREDETELEELLSLPRQVYESKTGRADYYALLQRHPRRDLPDEDLATWSDGEGDLDPDKARQLYPRLFKKFGHYWSEA